MSIYSELYKENKPVFESVKDRLVEKVTDDLRKYGATRIYTSNCNKEPFMIKRYPNGSDCIEISTGIAPHVNDFFKREDLGVYEERLKSTGAIKSIRIFY